jgi:hypothetical protein
VDLDADKLDAGMALILAGSFAMKHGELPVIVVKPPTVMSYLVVSTDRVNLTLIGIVNGECGEDHVKANLSGTLSVTPVFFGGFSASVEAAMYCAPPALVDRLDELASFASKASASNTSAYNASAPEIEEHRRLAGAPYLAYSLAVTDGVWEVSDAIAFEQVSITLSANTSRSDPMLSWEGQVQGKLLLSAGMPTELALDADVALRSSFSVKFRPGFALG